MSFKHERLEEIIKHYAAEYFSMESNRTSLITVTRVAAAERSNHVTVFFTVMPEIMEEAALNFLKRKRAHFRAFVRYNSRIMRTPFFDFEIDRGEKARQKIDQVMAK